MLALGLGKRGWVGSKGRGWAGLLLVTLALAGEYASALTVQGSEDRAETGVPESTKSRQILVFGGNGLLGSSTVERLITAGRRDNVTLVSRGNWYWDSAQRILPHVRHIPCDRKNGVESCTELVELVKQLEAAQERFTAVLDFSAYGAKDTRDAVALLAGRVDLYVHISTDSVYDVSDPDVHARHGGEGREGGCREEEAVRPEVPYMKDLLSKHYEYANRKMEAEEELVRQWNDVNGSHIPYVILRLPDVLGPRDTTHRFWTYQLWVRLAPLLPSRPLTIPQFLVDYNNSFVYSEDVARVIVDVIMTSADDVRNEAYNLAWHENITLEALLRQIAAAFKPSPAAPPDASDGDATAASGVPFNLTVDQEGGFVYFYPTVRRGPIDSSKAARLLGWSPTPWRQAIAEIVAFYEDAMGGDRYRFVTQKNEIVQIVGGQLYADQRIAFYETLEATYGIDLSHFRPRDEL